MILKEAVAKLQLHLHAAPEVNAALSSLITEALRQRKALEFYANPESYLDGVPSHADDDGDLMLPDDGLIARIALRRVDYHSGPGLVVNAEAAHVQH